MTPAGAGPRVALLDYDMSNLRSAGKALERLGARVEVCREPGEAGDADAVVLPGVGRFGAAMERLDERGFTGMLRDRASSGTPVLGICLGLQLLLDESEESPGVAGLGLIPGRVERLRTSAKVPHIGWSEVHWREGAALGPVSGGPADRTYYFVHSYACVPTDADDVLGTAEHGVGFTAAVGRGGVCGVQFHPEKSSAAGLELLDRWLAGVQAGQAVAS
ncbi:MAG: imidazole glycerol phosphate synthase subunit HisH [Thermoleophilia bacterium]